MNVIYDLINSWGVSFWSLDFTWALVKETYSGV